MDDQEEDLKSLVESMLKSSKRIVKNRNAAAQQPNRRTNQQELALRLLRIQEHIITARSVDPRTSDDIALLLDKVTLLLEQR